MLRKPPDILITTPESLFLLLTSQAREMLRGVETLILDEVHAVAGTKRGAHLALSLERLERLVGRASPAHRPLGDPAAARGDRPLRLGRPRRSSSSTPAAQGARPRGRRPGRGHARARLDRGPRQTGPPTASRWTPAASSARVDLAVDLPRAPAARRGAPLDDRLRQQPPARRAAGAAPERAGRARARARPPRLARARAAGRDRGAAEGAARSRASSPPRRSSSASTWAPSTS